MPNEPSNPVVLFCPGHSMPIRAGFAFPPARTVRDGGTLLIQLFTAGHGIHSYAKYATSLLTTFWRSRTLPAGVYASGGCTEFPADRMPCSINCENKPNESKKFRKSSTRFSLKSIPTSSRSRKRSTKSRTMWPALREKWRNRADPSPRIPRASRVGGSRAGNPPAPWDLRDHGEWERLMGATSKR